MLRQKSCRRYTVGLVGLSLVLGAFGWAPASEPGAEVLFDFASDRGIETRNGASVSTADGMLVIASDASNNNAVVRLGVPTDRRDLSARGALSFDVRNVSAEKVTFTVWALSPGGWGGVSSYPASNTDGRETIDPGATKTITIDLHARYPGPDVYTTATNPAEVEAVEFQFALAKTAKAGPQVSVSAIRATGVAPSGPPNRVSERLRVPKAERGPAGAGKRVYEQLPEWEGTSVTHVLGLPRNYVAGRTYPLIVEYTGNIFYHKFCYSTGLTDQGTMAYGLSKGEDYITLNLPFISEDGQREQVSGFGSQQKTVDYCLQAIGHVAEKYGADPQAVFVTGFSRGMYACNYIALADERIADVWSGVVAAKPEVLWDAKRGKGWNNVGIGWDERAARLKGRQSILMPANLGTGVHVDVEFLEDRPSTLATREWMRKVMRDKPGMSTISGRVVDADGKPVAGARVASGPTHFVLTDAEGRYLLTSLVPGERTVEVSKAGVIFGEPRVKVVLGEKESGGVDFVSR